VQDLPAMTQCGEGSAQAMPTVPVALNSMQEPHSRNIGGNQPTMPLLLPTGVVPPAFGQPPFYTHTPSYEAYLAFLGAMGHLPRAVSTSPIMHASNMISAPTNPGSSSRPVVYTDFVAPTNYPFPQSSTQSMSTPNN